MNVASKIIDEVAHQPRSIRVVTADTVAVKRQRVYAACALGTIGSSLRQSVGAVLERKRDIETAATFVTKTLYRGFEVRQLRIERAIRKHLPSQARELRMNDRRLALRYGITNDGV